MIMLTKKDAEPILTAFTTAGISAQLVGSIATKGQSSKDIDIVLCLKCEGEVYDWIEYPQFALYMRVMESLGFTMVSEGSYVIDTTEESYDEDVHCWQNGQIFVDIFPQIDEGV